MILRASGCRACQERQRKSDRLQERIAHLAGRNQQLQQRIAELEKDNQQLRRQTAQLTRTGQQQHERITELENENFQLRAKLDRALRTRHKHVGKHARDQPKPDPKKPGRGKGHKGANRPTPKPEHIDRVVNVPCAKCPDCHSELVEPATVVQYQTDLPPVVPIVTQFNIETGYCPCCRKRCQGRHPEQTSNATGIAGNTLGPVVLTMAAELKHRLGVPYRKICDFFSTYCNLKIAPATLARAEQRLARLAQPTYRLLIDALRQAGVVHADETGWRISRLGAWLWVFSTKDVTVYAIRTGTGARGHGVAEDILGPDFDGTLVVDGFNAYTVLEYTKGQCNAHLLRRCKDLRDVVPKREVEYLDALSQLVQEAIDLAARRDELTEQGYRRRVTELETNLGLWSMILPDNRSAALARLGKHVGKHLEEWFQFLHDPAVPPTNNHAERMLRPAVITRKVGGCNKTLTGALVHEILASIMVTCWQQGKKFLALAKRWWSADQPQATPIVDWPDG